MDSNLIPVPEIKIIFKDEHLSEREIIRHSKDCYDIFSPFFDECMYHHEEFAVMYLNARNKVIGVHKVARGGVGSVVVDVRHVMQPAILLNASAIVVAHNHPSGNLNASSEDMRTTDNIKRVCECLGIRLFDHLILADNQYKSFADEGLL